MYLWTNDPNTTQALQENVQNLNKSLHDIGLLPQPIFIATGKAPQGKDTQQPSLFGGSVILSS